MNVATALLVSAVVGDLSAVPLLADGDDGLMMTEASARILNTTETPLEIVLIAEMGEGQGFSLTNAYWQKITQDSEEIINPLSNDMLSDSYVWMIRAGLNPSTSREQIILATAFPDCDPTSNHRAAFSVAAMAAQDVLFHLPYDSDVTTRCSTLVTKLSHEAELTFKRVHGPVKEEGDGHLIVRDETKGTLNILPSAEVIVTGSLHLVSDSQNEFERLVSPMTSEGGAVTLFDRVAVKMVPLLPSAAPSVFTKTNEAITLLVASVSDTLSLYHEMSYWVHQGTSLVALLHYSIPRTAPGIGIGIDSVYSVALKEFVQKKSIEKYSAEMTGVIERGWLIKEDGSTFVALPQVGAANIVSDAGSEITSSDFKSLRPPATATLTAFHTSVVTRLSSQATSLLSRFAPEYIPTVTSTISRYCSESFETISASNANKIISFLTEHSKESVAAFINDVSSQQSQYPVPKKTITVEYERASKSAFNLFSQYAGDLMEDPHADLVKKDMRKQLAAEVDAQYSSNTLILESRIQRHFDAVVTLVSEFKTTLPTSKSIITEEIQKLESKAADTWDKLISEQFGGSVWPERSSYVESEQKKLMTKIKQACKQIVADNRAAIRSFIESVHEKLQKQFVVEVVNGKLISYPVSSTLAFDSAMTHAEGLIKDFKTETEEFSDDDSYPALLQEFHTQLQFKICGIPTGDSALAASSVMTRNVEEWSNQPWVQDAQISSKKQIQRNNGEGNPAEILAGKLLDVQGATGLDMTLRNKLADTWCINEGFDCPGICLMWSNKYTHAHWLDLAGLCEPDWWICNPSYETDLIIAKSNAKGWKVGQPFSSCPAPLQKPCAAYWDRKNRWSYKIFFRLVVAAHVVAAIVFVATSFMKRR